VAELLTVWFTVLQAAAAAQVGKKTIYNAVKAGRLRAARIGGGRNLRIHKDWISDWLTASSTPVEVKR
jgi:excisionase family DNA binding protein